MPPRILPLSQVASSGRAKAILARLQRELGSVPSLHATLAHSPKLLESMLGWTDEVAKGPLFAHEVEQIALHVSELNGCKYGVSAHDSLGFRAGLSEPDIMDARGGVGANERENALLAFARRIVRTGGGRAGAELGKLRAAGVDDAEIIEVLAVVALTCFANSVGIVACVETDGADPPALPGD